jgi:uncharacterized protein with von Willebrand factor type A (vWA) domain
MEQFMKMRRNRENGNSRTRSNICPYCLSSLVLDENNKYKCSNDRLKLWEKEVEKYKKLTVEQKQKYLKTLDSSTKFLDFINKEKIECEYSESLICAVSKETSIRLPDPLQVSKLEKEFNRRLTEEELEEGYVFYKDGKNYNIEFLNYPEDF